MWGLYQAYGVFSSQVVDTNYGVGGHYFTRIGYLPFMSLVGFSLLFGALEYIGIGLFLLCFGTLQAKIAWWGILIFLWMIIIAQWYYWAFISGGGIYDNLWPFNTPLTSILPWLGAALIVSFLLTGFGPLLQRFLSWLFLSIEARSYKHD
ncbi:hypothetical protein KDI_32840 [Dictyobacter arantiisoli]|uniref:Uncharacterized protein n=1 Tax=Dictyobacter arantiisoli TaxID=2014874 RepID=A0A5A5TDU7_9CHLR|nr:hypothetical protein KDI_32840 [Dictyobacter arantiisoli]